MKTDTSIITHKEQEEGHNGLPIIKQLYQQTGAKIIQVSMYNKLEQRSYRCPSTTRWSKCHTGVHVQQTGTKVIQVSMNNKLGQRSYKCPCTTNWSIGNTVVYVQ